MDQCSHQVGKYQRGSLWNFVTLLGMIHVFSDTERKDRNIQSALVFTSVIKFLLYTLYAVELG